MRIARWIIDDRIYAIVLSCAVAVFAVYQTIRTGKYLDQGWPHPVVIGGMLAAIFCVGLCLRYEWSRWVGMLFCVCGAALISWQAHLRGFTPTTIATLTGMIFVVWYLWHLPITTVQSLLSDPKFMTAIRERMTERLPELEARPTYQIALLLNRPLEFVAADLAGCAQRAFGKEFAVIERTIDPVDAACIPREHANPLVSGCPPILVCYNPPHLLEIYVSAIPFRDFSGDDVGLGRVSRDCLPDHSAFVLIEMLPLSTRHGPEANGFAQTGRLAAELLTDRCVGIYLPERRTSIPMSAQLPGILRGPDPFAADDESKC